MKLKVVLSTAALMSFFSAAYAEGPENKARYESNASPTIKERHDLFGGWANATKPLGTVLRGQGKFNLDATQAALKLYLDGSKKMPDLFPEDSKTGGKTEAMPAIWEDKAKFLAGFTKFEADANEALALIKDEDSFKANMPKVLANCGACHKVYKKPD